MDVGTTSRSGDLSDGNVETLVLMQCTKQGKDDIRKCCQMRMTSQEVATRQQAGTDKRLRNGE